MIKGGLSCQKYKNGKNPEELWATVELMGHGQTAGKVQKPTEWGGLLRVDVPIDNNGTFRTEFYGMASIYSVKFVSEEIARAFIVPHQEIRSYDAPIVIREEHDSVVRKLQEREYVLQAEIRQLKNRLTAVDALPEPDDSDYLPL